MLAKWIPNSEFSPLFDRVFSDPFFKDVAWPSAWNQGARELVPAADVVQTDQALRLSLDLPGLDPKDIQVKWEGDTLTVSAERKQLRVENAQYLRSERRYGNFSRSFVLPNTVDGARCEAEYLNGVLTLTLPKKEEAKPRAIEIKVG